jgi:hypothetical protein
MDAIRWHIHQRYAGPEKLFGLTWDTAASR